MFRMRVKIGERGISQQNFDTRNLQESGRKLHFIKEDQTEE